MHKLHLRHQMEIQSQRIEVVGFQSWLEMPHDIQLVTDDLVA